MCEITYDIKIYQVINSETETLVSYQVHIFNLSDPELYYQYSYPLQTNPSLFTPMFLGG